MITKAGQPTAFVSYAREDKAKVRRLCASLRRRGFRPWLDVDDILPGQIWKDTLLSAIRNAEFFVACLSTKSVAKRGVIQEEIREALAIWQQKLPEDIYLIPVRLESCDVPSLLTRFQWVDLFEKRGIEKLALALAEGARRLGYGTARGEAKRASDSSGAADTLALWGIVEEVEKYKNDFVSIAALAHGVTRELLGARRKVGQDELRDVLAHSLSATAMWQRILARKHLATPLLREAMSRMLATYILDRYWDEMTSKESPLGENG